VGGPINLSQQDLEICLRWRDDGLGDLDEQHATRDKLSRKSVGAQDAAPRPRDLRHVADNDQASNVEGAGH
jgi:hypothetical protein